eukprot:Rhum_TRINITY_DN6268_c0_g1::Rhum_TRINITY_DN6268_c0_g1_i1::g.19529::m.19529
MPSIKYDAQGNMHEVTTDEDSSTGAAPEQTPAAAKATHKRKKGVKRKKPGHDGSAAAASDGSEAEDAAAAAPSLLSAAAAFEEFKELEPELVKADANKDTLVPVCTRHSSHRHPSANTTLNRLFWKEGRSVCVGMGVRTLLLGRSRTRRRRSRGRVAGRSGTGSVGKTA